MNKNQLSKLLVLLMVCININVVGQTTTTPEESSDNTVHIQVMQEVNGEVINIDQVFEVPEGVNKEDFVMQKLQELGIMLDLEGGEEGEKIVRKEIIISDGQNGIVNGRCPDGSVYFPGCCPAAKQCGPATPANKAVMGVTIADTDNGQGVEVQNVSPDGGADAANLKVGDIITTIDKETTNSVDELITLLANYNPGQKAKVTYLRDGETQKAKVTLQERKEFVQKQNTEFKSNSSNDNDNLYPNKSTKENVKIITLKEGDVEKLLNGDELNVIITDAEGNIRTDELLIQLDENAKIDCPEFNVVITHLNEEETAVMDQNDSSIDVKNMGNLEVINLALYPNPNDGRFELDFSLDSDQSVNVRIVSIEGKEIFTQQIENFDGRYTNQLNLSSNPAGVYVLQIIQGNKMLTRKIVMD